MNRIFFVGLCLTAMLIIVFSTAQNEQNNLEKRQITKEHNIKSLK